METLPPEIEPPVSDDVSLAIHDLVLGLSMGQEPDVLYSFSGSIGLAGENKNVAYRSLSYSSVSEHGVATGSRTRVIATQGIAEAFPDLPIVTNSYNRFDPKEPTMASVIREELERRGVAASRISEETRSFSTITQLIEMVNDIVNNYNSDDGQVKWQNVAVMTNEYHQPRMKAMFNNLETIIEDQKFQDTLSQFRKMGINITFICAESVMRLQSPKFVSYLNKVEQSPQFKETLAGEAKGLADLMAGKYKVVLKPEKPRE